MKKTSCLDAFLAILIFLFAMSATSCSDDLLNAMARTALEASRPQIKPEAGTMITAHEQIVLTFPKDMSAATVTLAGTIGNATAVPSTVTKTNDTLTLDPPSTFWNTGADMTLVAKVSEGGQESTYEFSYEIFRGVCVATATDGGADGNAGTQRSPLLSIKKAIGEMTRPTGYNSSGEVRVAVGTYTLDGADTTNGRITMVEGVSLRGGYNTSWASGNPQPLVSTITDSSASVSTAPKTIVFGAGISRATVLEGFTITGASCEVDSLAVSCEDGASPTIRGNKILAGGNHVASPFRYAIGVGYPPSNTDKCGPLITGNTINDSANCGGPNITGCYGVYFFPQCFNGAELRGNVIKGGNAKTTLGKPLRSRGCLCAGSGRYHSHHRQRTKGRDIGFRLRP